MCTYVNIKAETQFISPKFKQECSKVELGEMIIAMVARWSSD